MVGLFGVMVSKWNHLSFMIANGQHINLFIARVTQSHSAGNHDLFQIDTSDIQLHSFKKGKRITLSHLKQLTFIGGNWWSGRSHYCTQLEEKETSIHKVHLKVKEVLENIMKPKERGVTEKMMKRESHLNKQENSKK